MNILEKEFDPIIGANVITRYKKPIYYLDFNNTNESRLNENNPKKMIFSFNTVMANLCNKNKTDRILLAGLGGGTIIPAFKSKNNTTLDCLDISSCVIKQFKKFFYPVLKDSIDPNITKINFYNTGIETYIKHCKNKYNTIIIDCFKMGGIDDEVYTILDELPKIMEKDGNVVIDIHSSRFGQYSNNFHIIKKYFNPKLWKIRTYLSNAKDSYEFGNLIIEGKLKCLST
jgi:spermidine synthase